MEIIFDRIKLLNPERITVDDICQSFQISRIKARTLCEMAVTEGIFKSQKENNIEFYILIR